MIEWILGNTVVAAFFAGLVLVVERFTRSRPALCHLLWLLALAVLLMPRLPLPASPVDGLRRHIVYGLDGALWAAPFDLAQLRVTGAPVPVLDGVLTKASGAADFALASDGSLAYLSGTADVAPRTLTWVTQDGQEESLMAPATWQPVSRVWRM